MRRNQLTITYPEGDAQQLHQSQLLQKGSRCVNISALCREARGTGGSQVKTITIRLPDVEAAMLVEVQKRKKAFKDLQQLLIQQVRQEYQKSSGGSGR